VDPVASGAGEAAPLSVESGGLRHAPSLRHRVEYRGVLTLASLVRALPRRLAGGIGIATGLLFFAVDRRHRRLAVANLAAAFPQWPRRKCVTTAGRVYVHLGRLLAELLRFHGLTTEQVRARVEIVGADRLLQAQRGGKGTLFITGHFGFWELHAIAHGALFAPVAVVARPLDNPLLHDLLEQARTSTGNTVIYRKGGLRRILKALAMNQGVAMLIDQHIQPADALTVEFFGRPAATTAAVAVLALRTGAPVVPVFALPLPRGRFRLVYEHAIPPPESDGPEDLRRFTQRCTDVLEMYVQRHPHLWLWMHRRWRLEEGS
jgi:KDO2-lipid IV(A) lauroyltransferase